MPSMRSPALRGQLQILHAPEVNEGRNSPFDVALSLSSLDLCLSLSVLLFASGGPGRGFLGSGRVLDTRTEHLLSGTEDGVELIRSTTDNRRRGKQTRNIDRNRKSRILTCPLALEGSAIVLKRV